MIKQQNSSRKWSQIRLTILMTVAVFVYITFIFASTISAIGVPGPVGGADGPVTTTGKAPANGKFATADEACLSEVSDAATVSVCKKGYENALEGKNITDACSDQTGAKIDACQVGATVGVDAKKRGAKAESEKAASNPDCTASLSSPLSWIICPIVDLGAGFTDFIFTTFVRGLLQDVPISAEAGNGSFEAWKQFRTIGNIVLLGTLIAVVYSQARSK